MSSEQAAKTSETDAQRLSYLAQEISRTTSFIQYVDYQQAEKDSELLAERLLGQFSRDDLRSFTFVPIPRGGYFVLGMLAYILNLDASQLESSGDPVRPQVMVDDCALTGFRFGQYLKRTPAANIVFAHLYSHPELRHAISQREPRVKACVAAHDLANHAREKYKNPEEYQAWLDRWSNRYNQAHYWLGLPDMVCFAWNEPDHPFFNPASGSIESGWRFLPPHLSLKNRVRLGLPPKSVLEPLYQTPTAIVHGVFDDLLWLVNTQTEQVYQLSGPAADIWRGLAVYGSQEATTAHLIETYEVAEAQAAEDVRVFAASLVAKGLLEHATKGQ